MSGTISVDPDRLRQHAELIRQLADDVGEAVAAARSADVTGGAFGVICSFLVPPAAAITSITVGAITEAEGMLVRTARELRGAADDAEEYERRITDHIESISRAAFE